MAARRLVRALFDYAGDTAGGDLSFKANDIVTLVDDNGGDVNSWWCVSCAKACGGVAGFCFALSGEPTLPTCHAGPAS